MQQIKKSYKHLALLITTILYTHPAFALISEIRDQVVSDINIWIFMTAGIMAAIGLIFKNTRQIIFGFLSAAIAVYMFWTIIRLVIITDIY